jgi:hypothetical protein
MQKPPVKGATWIPAFAESTPQKRPSYCTNILGGIGKKCSGGKDGQGQCLRDDGSRRECCRTDEGTPASNMRSLDMTTLLHEIFLCQDQLDEIARRRQPLMIKKSGSYASISGEFTTRWFTSILR